MKKWQRQSHQLHRGEAQLFTDLSEKTNGLGKSCCFDFLLNHNIFYLPILHHKILWKWNKFPFFKLCMFKCIMTAWCWHWSLWIHPCSVMKEGNSSLYLLMTGNLFSWLLLLLNDYYWSVCVCTCMHIAKMLTQSQRTTSWRSFFPSTIWTLGTELGPPHWVNRKLLYILSYLVAWFGVFRQALI